MHAVDAESQEHKGRWRRFAGPLALGIVMLLSVLGAAYGTYSASRRSGMAQIDDMAIHQLDLYASTLESELARYADLPGLLGCADANPDTHRYTCVFTDALNYITQSF